MHPVNVADDPTHETKYNAPMEQKLDDSQIAQKLPKLKGWSRSGDEISKTFNFKNFYETMSFVNAVAHIANQLDHHPDMEVGYNKLSIRFSTHSVGGLSENDFAAAAKIDALS
jgi:4a-hydroxytetrahydrobiopterin dehydratase